MIDQIPKYVFIYIIQKSSNAFIHDQKKYNISKEREEQILERFINNSISAEEILNDEEITYDLINNNSSKLVKK